MDEINGINHVGLRIKDLAITRAFYEKLGFDFIAGPIGPEPVAVMTHPSGVNINFIINANSRRGDNVLMDDSTKHCGFTHVALNVWDLLAVKASLNRLGIAITEGPIVLPDGGQMLFVRDPDSNVIEFHMERQESKSLGPAS